MSRKYYNAKTFYDKASLYYIKAVPGGYHKGVDVITQKTFAWYFCVTDKDAREHSELFKDLRSDGLVSHMSPDGAFWRIYCDKVQWDDDCDAQMVLDILSENKIETYEADLQLHDRYIIDNDIPIEDTGHYIGHFDIETRDDNGADIVIGRDRIISIAVVDQFGNEFVFCDDSEITLLKKAFQKLKEFSILTTWYGSEFDWPQIYERARVCGVEFPLWDVNHLDLYKWFEKALMAGMIEERAKSKALNDVCEQYIGIKKTEGVKAGGGNLWRLFKENRKLLKEYNLQDCRLLWKLDEKMNITKQCIRQSVITKSFVGGLKPTQGGASPTELTDKFLLNLAYKENTRLKTKVKVTRKDRKNSLVQVAKTKKKDDKESKLYDGYPGGRVYIKSPGLRDKVMSFDFAGYYNSIMRTLNIGPDTIMTYDDLKEVPEKKRPYIPIVESPYTYLQRKVILKYQEELDKEGIENGLRYRVVKGYNLKVKIPEIVIKIDDGKDEKGNSTFGLERFIEHLYPITRKVWDSYSDNLTITLQAFGDFFLKLLKSRVKEGKRTLIIRPPMPVYFRQDFDSIVRKCLNIYTDERGVWKKRKKVADDDPTIKSSSIEYKNILAEVNAWKLLGNIVYGQTGSYWARIFHPAIAVSVTLTGQISTEWTRKYFKKAGMEVVYMDTDSNYIFDPMYSPEREKRFLKFFQKTYHKQLHNFLWKCFGIKRETNCIFLEYEKRWLRLMLLAKKRYVGKIEWEDGKGAISKLVSRGVELRRTATTLFSRTFQEEYYDMIFQPEIPSEQDFWDFIERKKKEFYNIEFNTPETLELITKRLNLKRSIEDYKASTPQVNLMIRCRDRGTDLHVGDMLQFVYLKIQEKQKKKYPETVEYYLENNEKLVIDVDDYWNNEIFKPLFPQLRSLFPDRIWGSFDTENDRIALKKMDQLTRRIKKKSVEEQKKTLSMIVENKGDRLDKPQILELLDKAEEGLANRELFLDEIETWRDYYENNKHVDISGE